jgi:hypothetical protein
MRGLLAPKPARLERPARAQLLFRSPGMNPFSGTEDWNFLRRPDFDDLDVR